MKDSKTITENRMRTYENFLQEKAALTVLVEQIGELAQHMDLGSESLNNFERVKNIITNDAFRVIFVGSFSRGKSTTINALLGNQILPSKLAPATAISTVIRYGEEPKATVFFRDNTISPESMDIEDVRDYLLIPRDGLIHNGYGSHIETKLERVEIEYPVSLCENGVELIDTPGLEENETRQKITLHFLNHADAAIVLLSCQQLITTEEERFIKQELQSRGFDNIFYVINFCDDLMTSEDEEDIEHRAVTKLGENERIFMLSAREALRGKMNGDPDTLADSRFQEFEQALESFLVKERGTHKLRTSSNMMFDILGELESLAALRLNLLHKDRIEELEVAEKQFNERKKDITQKKQDVIDRIGEIGVTIGDKLCDGFNKKCRQMSRALPEVASELEIETGLIGSLTSREEYQREVAKRLEDYVKTELEDWGANEAREIIAPHVDRLHRTLDRDIASILKDIDNINILLNPEFAPSVKADDNPMERLVAVAGSLIIGDIGGAVTGGLLGIKGSLMQIGTVLAGSSVLYLLGFLNPVTAVILSVGTAAALIAGQGSTLQMKMRTQVAEQLATHILDLPELSERKIREMVFTELQKWQVAVDKGVEGLLGNIEQQFLSAKQEIIENKEAAQHRYSALSQEIDEINTGLVSISAAWSEKV